MGGQRAKTPIIASTPGPLCHLLLLLWCSIMLKLSMGAHLGGDNYEILLQTVEPAVLDGRPTKSGSRFSMPEHLDDGRHATVAVLERERASLARSKEQLEAELDDTNKRLKFAGLELEGLQAGEWRAHKQVEALKMSCDNLSLQVRALEDETAMLRKERQAAVQDAAKVRRRRSQCSSAVDLHMMNLHLREAVVPRQAASAAKACERRSRVQREAEDWHGREQDSLQQARLKVGRAVGAA